MRLVTRLIAVWAITTFVSSTIPYAHGQPKPVRLITHGIDDRELVVLRGNTHPMARPQFDRGAAPNTLPMERMLLVLKRSPEQEAALEKFMDEQLDRTSVNYHRWLTPEEFGQQFGPAEQDIEAVSSWLKSCGFLVTNVSKSRRVMEFSGTAGEILATFHAAIHKYVVDGDEHWANSSDPLIPAALAPVVGGVATMHSFASRSSTRFIGEIASSRAGGTAAGAKPQDTLAHSCGLPGDVCHAITPYDFAAIYNVTPLWKAGLDGSGQAIAIPARSNINIQDVRNFRSLFGLPPKDPVILVNGRDPGVTGVAGDALEAVSDTEWAGAVARGADIDLVVSASTNATDGSTLSVEYIIDRNVAPILSVSFGACELDLGTATNELVNSLWQQAAAQGITVLVGSGDPGSAGCDDYMAGPPHAARLGFAVNGIASTPYDVAVGSTDFSISGDPQTYWSATNDATTLESARGYVPEIVWNDACASPIFAAMPIYRADPEANCDNPALSQYVHLRASGGGSSNCTVSSGQSAASCSGGYAKPSWQAGPGVPADGRRDVPDVSIFGGSLLSGTVILLCDSHSGYACAPGDPAVAGAVGATSWSVQVFGGLMALVDQNTNARQGNANAVLYGLAAQQSSVGCDAGASSSACIFHDITSGTNAMPCVRGSPNCVVTNVSDAYGVLSGYQAARGYDLATGLGSVDALNMVTATGWSPNSSAAAPGGARSLVNAASYAAPVAAGSIATAFGDFLLNQPVSASGVPVPPILDGLSLKFSPGIPVPTFYASATQVNIQIPWELAGAASSSLTATLAGQASSQYTVTLAAFAPGIFSVNGQGSGQGAVLDAHYKLVEGSNPTAAGDVVQIYCTGLGPVTNQPASGEASPYSPLAFTLAKPTITIGGLPARVLFSGLAPGSVGLYQVNAEVPAGVLVGPAAPVALSIAGKASNTVTMAVH